MDQGAMGMKGFSAFPQSSSITGTSLSDFLVSLSGHSLAGVLPQCRDAVGVFCSPPSSRLGKVSSSQMIFTHFARARPVFLSNTNDYIPI